MISTILSERKIKSNYIRRAAALLLCVAVAATGTLQESFAAEDTAKDSQPYAQQEVSAEKGEPVLAYVPLDNRTINVDRVIYQAESAGFKVKMPDSDLYTTRLDGQPRNKNGTSYGDGKAIMDWLEAMDAETDYFVISLDQILSGGLVNSRVISDRDNREEYALIDRIIRLSENNRVYVTDTVLRLASCTVGYNGADINTYSYLRNFNLQPRQELKDFQLSVESIVKNYRSKAAGGSYVPSKEYANVVNESYKVRERKLELIDYMLKMSRGSGITFFVGIDDSSAQPTIQTNEINFIRKKLGDRGEIYSGTDELGMMAVMHFLIDYYGCDINVAEVYFGGSESVGAGNGYDYDADSVKQNLERHLKSLGVKITGKSEADVEVVVLTAPSDAALNSKYISNMIDYINANIDKNKPTIVINAAASAYSNNFEYRMLRDCETSMLMSYSSWNTVGNAMGVALTNGLSRYLYLSAVERSGDLEDKAFVKGLAFSFAKDISYMKGGGKSKFTKWLQANSYSPDNFYQSEEQVEEVNKKLREILFTSDSNVTVNDIISNMTGTRYIKSLDGGCGIIRQIGFSNYSAPFFRTFEIRFDVNTVLGAATMTNVSPVTKVLIPYNPPAGSVTYSTDLYYLDRNGKMIRIPSTYDKVRGVLEFDANLLKNMYISTSTMNLADATSMFSDVAPTAWYFDSVMAVYSAGLMNGTSEGVFSPAQTVSAKTFAVILSRLGASEALQQSVRSKEGTFTRLDLAKALYALTKEQGITPGNGAYAAAENYRDVHLLEGEDYTCMSWACTNGIINGKNGLLAYDSTVTRAELAAMITRFNRM